MTTTEKALIKQVSIFLRTETIDGLIDAPSEPEIQIAINMAVGEINTTPPISGLSVDKMYVHPQYNYLLTIGTAKYVIMTLVSDWTHNGLTATIEEFSIEDRLSNYTTLLDKLTTEFSDRLKEVKPYINRVVRTKNILVPKISPRGNNNNGVPSLITPFPYTMFRIK